MPISPTGSPPRQSVFQSAAAAYRADLGSRATAFGPNDGGWLTVATLVEHAGLLAGEERDSILREAVEQATDILGRDEVARLGFREWQDRDRAATDPVMLLSEAIRHAGALNLASVVLDALSAADASLNTVQQGRVLAQRARIALFLGQLDAAADQYRRVEAIGRAEKNEELKVRAWIGYASLAQMHGNYPELLRFSRRAARVADREGFARLARQSHFGLMVVAGVGHRYDDALLEGWAVYECSLGDPMDEASSLQSLGQLLLESGHPTEARAAFAAVLSQIRPARIIMSALGGLALASAATQREDLLDWALHEVQRAQGSTPPYLCATALLECAIALAGVARAEEAERCRDEALRLAQTYGFHEIAFRAESLDTAHGARPAGQPRPLSAPAAKVARSVAWMEPEQLPHHVALSAAPE